MYDLKRLRWQCRRGVKELDAVLCAYLDHHYLNATAQEQHLFAQLLTLEDDQLIAYFFADRVQNTQAISPTDQETLQFVDKIRTTFVD